LIAVANGKVLLERSAVMQFAFTRCGELNLNGMVEAHLAIVEAELLGTTTLVS
jgi:hypothetical protein